MPLMISPVDGKPMRQAVRFGVEVDVCPTTGGVWLDKGEFDKLARLIRDEPGPASYEHASARRHWLERRDDEEEDDPGSRHGRRGKSALSELFDF